MKPTYIALDTETGGIGPEVSLLTAYFAVLDEDMNVIDELDLAIKPDDNVYHVTAEALSINKINLVEHQAKAITRGKAGELLRGFLVKNAPVNTLQDKRLIPLGHNVTFDLEKIYQHILNKSKAQKFISYRTLDTGSIGRFLITAGIIPNTVSGSLGSYVKHLGVKTREAHTARGDVEMTVDVMKAMLSLVRL
jgi:DNA polymerase III alpha subunit (gram-positive type)